MRRLAVLVEGLPPDSALRRDGRMWTLDNELAAVGIELMQMWSARHLSVWLEKGSKVPPVVPITHPDRATAQPAPKHGLSAREAAARMGMG